jgi:hypothetical protein
MTKLTKKKVDVFYIDPKTMEQVCSFNQCVDKFTIEGEEIKPTKYGKEFVTCYHECTECGRREISQSDKKRAAKIYRERGGQSKFENEFDRWKAKNMPSEGE